MLTQRDTRFPSNKRCVSVHLNDLIATHDNNAQRYDLVLRGWAPHQAAGHTACEFGGVLRGQRFVFRHVRGDVSLGGGINFDRIESANPLSLVAGRFNFDADRFHGY